MASGGFSRARDCLRAQEDGRLALESGDDRVEVGEDDGGRVGDVCPRSRVGRVRDLAWGAQTRSRSEIRGICRRIVFTHPTGYQRIAGELNGLGITVSATTVRKLLREAGLGPAGERAGLSWRGFLRAQAQSVIAADFFTVETVRLKRLYVLFFIELGSRRVHLAGCSANPDSAWVTQRARQLAWSLSQRPTPLRFLIHDRDSKFSRSFDAVFRSESLEIIRTPVRAPQANAIAERFVRTARAECLDWLLILGRRHLEQVLRVFVAHCNGHRPHRALNLTPPDRAAGTLRALNASPLHKLRRTDRLGGLIHEYRLAA
jgi:putative transposase